MSLSAAALVFLGLTTASLAVVTYDFTVSGSAAGLPVSAEGHFTVDAGKITITLANTTTFTQSPAQLLTGIDFSLNGSDLSLTSSALTSETAIARTVAGNGTYTDSANPVTINWALSAINGTSGSYLQLQFGSQANFSIIGPGSPDYSGAKGGIKANSAHNPFAAETATFVLNDSKITAATKPADLRFYFGTGMETAIGFTPVPEPSSVFVFGTAFAVACLGMRRPRRAS